MTQEQLDLPRLRELALKATPGPWTNTSARSLGYKSPMPDFHAAHIHVGPRENYGNALATVVMGGRGATGSSAAEVDANAAFIAAANPMTFLALPPSAPGEAVALANAHRQIAEQRGVLEWIANHRNDGLTDGSAATRACLDEIVNLAAAALQTKEQSDDPALSHKEEADG